MNSRGPSSVIRVIIWTVLFLPEFLFYLLSWLNYCFWDRAYPRGSKINVRLYWWKNKATVWCLREQESLEEKYLPILGEIMPIKTKSKIEQHEYVPTCEKDTAPEEQTVFILKDLKHSESVEVSDNLWGLGDDGAVDRLRPQTLAHKMVLRRLVGWRNLFDENGNEIKFTTNKRELERIMDEVALAAPDVMAELEQHFGLAGGVGKL